MSSLRKEFSLTAIIAMIANDWLLEEKGRSLLGEYLDCWLMAEAKN